MLVHCKTYAKASPTWYRVSGRDGEGHNILAHTKADARERYLNAVGRKRMPRGFTIYRLHGRRPVTVIPVTVQKARRKRAVRKPCARPVPVTLAVTTQPPVARNVLSDWSWIEPHAVVLA